MRLVALLSFVLACSGDSRRPLDDAPPSPDALPDAPPSSMRARSTGIVPAGGRANSERYRFVGSLSAGTPVRSETKAGATGIVGGGQ